MTCPGCGGPLRAERHRGIEIDACGGCHGMWFDRGELDSYWRLSRSADERPPVEATAFHAEDHVSTLVCPRCRASTLSAARVDVFHGGPCSRCRGVWLSPSQEPPRRTLLDPGGGLIDAALEVAGAIFDLADWA